MAHFSSIFTYSKTDAFRSSEPFRNRSYPNFHYPRVIPLAMGLKKRSPRIPFEVEGGGREEGRVSLSKVHRGKFAGRNGAKPGGRP